MVMVLLCDMKVAQLKYCNKGARMFCARHNLDFQQFRHHGLPEEDLLATGDAMAKKVVEVARNRVKNGQ